MCTDFKTQSANSLLFLTKKFYDTGFPFPALNCCNFSLLGHVSILNKYVIDSSSLLYRILGDFNYVPLQRVNPRVLRKFLKDYPDPEEAEWVVNGFTNGFPLGIDPERRPEPREPCLNSAAAQAKSEELRKLVQKELDLGHMLGPFDEPPLPNMVYSPLHLVPKAGNPDEYRLIHNLAFPYTEQSVNKSIPKEESSVHYHYIDELIEMAIDLGENIWGCRVDFSHAFRNLGVCLADLALLGFYTGWQVLSQLICPIRSGIQLSNLRKGSNGFAMDSNQ